jgi:tetratricopeptide (TPR) repeat protein
MAPSPWLAAGVAWLLCLAPLGGPGVSPGAPPASRLRPPTKEELRDREAQRLFALGILQEKEHHFRDAIRTFEKASALDPDAASIHRSLSRLYFTLGQTEQGVRAGQRALQLDPDDFQTGYRCARELRWLDRHAEAVTVLERSLKARGLDERPELRLAMCRDLANLHERLGHKAKALDALAGALDVLAKPDPLVASGVFSKEEVVGERADTWQHIGELRAESGQLAEALKAFGEVEKIAPRRRAQLDYPVARILARQGKPREGLEHLERYLRTGPAGGEPYRLHALLLRRLGRSREVLPSLARYVRDDPDNRELALLLASELRQAGRKGEARKTYRALADRTADFRAYRGLFALVKEQGPRGIAGILDELDDTLKAAYGGEKDKGDPKKRAHARAMKRALAGDPRLTETLLQTALTQLPGGKKLSFATLNFLADLAERTDKLATAERLYCACLDSPYISPEVEQRVYQGLLDVLTRAHKHREVLEVCRKGLARAERTNQVLFHLKKAWAHLSLGQVEPALAASAKAVQMASDHNRLRCQLSHVQMLSVVGKHDEAIAQCLRLFDEYNQADEVRKIRMTLSTVYLDAGQPEKSEAQLFRILEADPDDATANNNLGYQWAVRNKNLARAEKYIRKAIDLDRKERGVAVTEGWSDEDNYAFLDSLAWVLFRKGQLREAVEVLKKAAAQPMGADDPVVWDHLGDVYFRMGQKEQARKAWEKAVALYRLGSRPPIEKRHEEIKKKIVAHGS